MSAINQGVEMAPAEGAPEVAAAAASAEPLTEADFPRSVRLRHAFGNLCLAILFFSPLLGKHSPYNMSGLGAKIFLVGAVLMGVMSLVRVPARSAMVNVRSILSTAAMVSLPELMRVEPVSTAGLLYGLGIALELIGMTFTQASRIYLGRRFGLLPANRGIVAGGPFRLMRHPIYSGWLVLSIGFLLLYPTWWNIGMMVLSMPFLVWRIELEEEHLNDDQEYRAYAQNTRYRLIPYIY